jgi:hypothetical protein
MAGQRPGHVRLSSTLIVVLVVQENPDYPISETGLSSFHRFKALDRPHPFTSFSLFSLTHSRTTVRVTPRPPLVIPWFLRGILEFLGEINSQEPVSPFPQPIFPILRFFPPNPRSLCPMDGFEVPLVHCLHSCPISIPCNISMFPWLNRSDS